MTSPSFRYPRSGVLLARLLIAMGHGPKSWPGRQISASTFKKIAADEPVTFALREFVDEALGLLGSPDGRWQLGPATMNRTAAFDLVYSALRAYDRAVSELNAGLSSADPRHALPILSLLAVRLGAFVGLVAGVRAQNPGELWDRTPLEPAAFCKAVTRLAEAAMPKTSWRERGEASKLGKNTLDRWRTTPPGENFKFSSLKKFTTWVAARTGVDARPIEWRLRWLAAGARIHGALDRYLGADGHGEPWIDRLRLTAVCHARLNYDLCTEPLALALALRWLAPETREQASESDALAIRRLFSWVFRRTEVIDAKQGPALTDAEMLAERDRVATDEPARREF